jgi:hypothetical protein
MCLQPQILPDAHACDYSVAPRLLQLLIFLFLRFIYVNRIHDMITKFAPTDGKVPGHHGQSNAERLDLIWTKCAMQVSDQPGGKETFC